LSGSELLKEATERTEDGQSILRVKAAKVLATGNYEMLKSWLFFSSKRCRRMLGRVILMKNGKVIIRNCQRQSIRNSPIASRPHIVFCTCVM